MVLLLGRLLVIGMVLFLAGCGTASRRHGQFNPAVEPVAVALTPEPALAPPPAAGPGPVPKAAPPQPAAPAATAANEFSGTWIPLIRWVKTQGWPAPSQVQSGTPPAYVVDGPHGKLTLQVGSTTVVFAGLNVRLGYAPQLIDNLPYVHAVDLKKTIQPLLSGLPQLSVAPRPVIVIDPGHGGTDSGTKSVLGSFQEKQYTLDWAQRLGQLLQTAGWQVHLTRTSDVEISISNRVAFAEKCKADLFVSLHFNSAAPNETESGLETYCLTPVGLPSNLTRGYADDLSQAFPNNAFDSQNLALALRVHSALLRVNAGVDRGLRRARFLGVLRAQQRPSVLVEGAYLSNRAEARRVASPEYRQKLAEATASALLAAVAPAATQVGAVSSDTPPSSAPPGISVRPYGEPLARDTQLP